MCSVYMTALMANRVKDTHYGITALSNLISAIAQTQYVSRHLQGLRKAGETRHFPTAGKSMIQQVLRALSLVHGNRS